ncbi:Protein M3 [Actinomortierella wolfii]|nr:Protein M3 [Actinomortierella wolfii]
MLSCVSQDNIQELGYVAIIAALWIIMGGLFGLFIQRVCRVPKRIYWGIVAATMFTNFGDLPISIILAVSDHPPFLVGDGAKGTAYASVFITVFYFFLFPLGGYRLIRYDHVKESKRIAAMNANHENNGNILPLDDPHHGHEAHQMTVFYHPSSQQGTHGKGSPIMQGQGLCSTFSSTSTMVSFDDRSDYGGAGGNLPKSISTQHMSTIPLDESPKYRTTNPFHDDQYTQQTHSSEPRSAHGQNQHITYSPPDASRSPRRPSYPNDSSSPCSSTSSSGGSTACTSSGYPSPAAIQPPLPVVVPPPVPVAMPTLHQNPFGVPSYMTRYSVDSNSSNLTRYTNHTHHDDDSGLIQPHHKRTSNGAAGGASGAAGTGGAKGGLTSSSSFRASAKKASLASIAAIRQATLVSSRGSSGTSANSCGNSGDSPSASSAASPAANGAPQTPSVEPLPVVPPQLERSYKAKEKGRFWSIVFHTTREYLTPPTIGLILGLIVALTPPLRALFVVTDHPVPSFDELPPLSFIHEVTILLGGCCVPLGLTVLGASLSRLKPGRWRPLVPALTMITLIKLVVCPILGIYLVQRWLVHGWGIIDIHNHMLQFTLMLMSGTPTSIICFVLAQVWDQRSKNAGAEMAAVIAVQYAAGTVLITILSAFMMYFLFTE